MITRQRYLVRASNYLIVFVMGYVSWTIIVFHVSHNQTMKQWHGRWNAMKYYAIKLDKLMRIGFVCKLTFVIRNNNTKQMYKN